MKHDPNTSLGALLNDLARLIRKKFDQRAKNLGLTRAQYYLLAKLSRHEGINQVGLADLLEVEPISLARLVDRMEAAGWLQRRPDPADRRARRLYLTPKSRPVIDRIRVIAVGIYDEALAGLDRTARDQLIASLVHARRNLSEPVSAQAAPLALTGT
jgi:MarR family transcriptional regulator, transcriptional regulator for hemolysin